MAEEETPLTPASGRQSLLSFLILLIVVGLLGLAFFFGLKFRTAPLETTPTPTPEAIVETTPVPTEKLISPAEDEELIKKAIYEKTGLNENKALITISKNTGEFATGGIKEYEAVGGAYWLAAKTTEGWIGVYDGQSQPECEQIDLYDFPKDMVLECMNENGKVVKR